MKSNFLAGVAILFPIVLTCLFINFFINLLTKPFLGFLRFLLPYETPEFVLFFSKLLILLALGIIFCAIGILGRLLLGKYFFQSIDTLARRIPIINRIYIIIQESVQTLFNGAGAKFSKVVLVPFPSEKSYSIGFVTNEKLPQESQILPSNLVVVFVPGAPIPTIGYMLLYREDQLFPINLSVDEGIKFILSCGSITKEIALLPSKN